MAIVTKHRGTARSAADVFARISELVLAIAISGTAFACYNSLTGHAFQPNLVLIVPMLALFTAFGGGAGIFHVGPAALLLLVPPVLLVFGLFLVTRYITHFFIRIGAAVITCTAFVLIASYVLTALGGA